MRPLKGARLASIVAIGFLAVALVAIAIFAHSVVGLPQGLVLALMATIAVFERSRYVAARTSPTATATGERFRDPVSGKFVEVYYDAGTGARSYRTIS